MNLQYISGFFDADGSITMSYSNKTDKFRTIKIDFTNCEKSILMLIQEFLKTLEIHSFISTKPARKLNHNIAYTLSVSSNQHGLRLCALLDSIHPKKKHRINTILKYHNQVTKKNVKYTEREFMRKLAYERLFFSSNFH